MRLYNTLTRRKEELVPLRPGAVRMYVCGVTVYDLCHVGHARSAIVFDVIRRYLTFRGYRVTFVRNYTDVDDKIINRAQEEGVAAMDLAERYVAETQRDMAAIGVRPADVEPRATEHVQPMIELIERLLAQGYAYVVDGDVYFEIRRFPRYGRLSGRNLDELLVGARVEVDERKRDPRDFALWKAAKPGEPAWASPWGQGRPGWHIECSAMAMRYLGESFDIHGGGEDLIFPHHECEIAQSEAATGQPFARYWVHNGFVKLGAEKMSKSLGNILTIKELVKRHDPETLRYYLLDAHYRGPVDFWEARLPDFQKALGHLRILIGRTFHLAGQAGLSFSEPRDQDLRDSVARQWIERLGGDELMDQVEVHHAQFVDGMDDDFNTPQALAALSSLGSVLNRYHGKGIEGERLRRFLAGVKVLFMLGRVLGLFYRHVNPFEFSPAQRAEIDPLIQAREEARRRRDWERADALREQLDALGVVVEDRPDGPVPRWKGAARE